MAKKVDELPLYQRVEEFSRAVIAILDGPGLRRSRKLWEQIADANDSVVANFAEGFEQATDAGFASYLVYSKASIAEVIKRLKQAERRRSIRNEELAPLETAAEEISRMLGGFIKYLRASDFKERGSYQAQRLVEGRDSSIGFEDSG